MNNILGNYLFLLYHLSKRLTELQSYNFYHFDKDGREFSLEVESLLILLTEIREKIIID